MARLRICRICKPLSPGSLISSSVREAVGINSTSLHFPKLLLQDQQSPDAYSSENNSKDRHPNGGIRSTPCRPFCGPFLLPFGAALARATFYVVDEPFPPIEMRLLCCCLWVFSFGIIFQ